MVQSFRLAAVALLALGSLLLAPGSALAAGTPVPFSAIFSGTAAFTSPTTTSFVGSGIARHMGLISTNGGVDITGFDNTTCSGGVANVNHETLTAPDGTTLTIASQDVSCPTGPGQYHGSGHWTVVGGTGRFDGATGEGSLDGSANFVAGTFTITLTGSITF